MKNHKEQHSLPLHFVFSLLAKNCLGVLTRKLNGKGPDRYFYTLLVIHNSGETLTQQQIADYMKVDKTSMVRVIDSLSKSGFIRRKVNPDDRRQHLLQLTSKAKAVLPVIEEAIAELNSSALKGLSENDKKIFYASLEKICCNISQLPSDNFFLNFKKINKHSS